MDQNDDCIRATKYETVCSEQLTVLFKYDDQFTNVDRLNLCEQIHANEDQPLFAFEYGEEVTRRINDKNSTETEAEQRTSVEESPAQTKVDIDSFLSPLPITADQKTPHSNKRVTVHRKSKKRSSVLTATPPKTRETPLPLLSWADSTEVWQNMIFKEEVSMVCRSSKLFDKRASFLPRMRAILLDWIMEVCEVYRLRRVTYYLAVDYIDRYLRIRPDVPKTQLQLVGVSCLFMAAKLEEVYPPKISEFSYVCDGACTNSEILACELLILNSLGWDVNPMTPSGWLNLYMQIYYDGKSVAKQKLHNEINFNFIYCQYSGYQFVRASQIIDLFSLDPGFLRYSYSVIAAAAMYFIFGKQVALSVSGLCWDQLKDCTEYMAVFYKVIRDSSDPKLQSAPSHGMKTCPLKVPLQYAAPDENHSMQTHCIDLDYFEKATLLRLEQMGFRVQKTYVKKIKKKNKEEKREGDENSTNEEDETTVVMFDIEKINMETCIAPECKSSTADQKDEESSVEVKVGSNVNIFSIEKKTRVSFDDILASIHLNIEGNRAQSESSESEDEESS